MARSETSIGKNIKRLMALKGASAKQVCHSVEIPQSSFSEYLNSSKEPKASTLLKLAKYFNVTVEELIQPPDLAPLAKDVIGGLISSLDGRSFTEIHSGVYRVIIQKETPQDTKVNKK
jgi:transcriptional regulator with XRE-family HTH domain